MSFWIAGSMAVLTAYSANRSSKAQNRAADRASRNAERRYALQAGVAENQMEEQENLALEKMTEVTRKFLVAKGKAEVVRDVRGVTGNVAQRERAVSRTKASEVKGKVAKEIDTNVINIAQDMLAKKIDTEAMIAEAQSKKKNVMFETLMGGIQGGLQGYFMGKSINSGTGTGVKEGTSSGTNAFDASQQWDGISPR